MNITEIQLYKLLRHYRHRITRLQYTTIKGQIRKGDLLGAYKGIQTCINRN